MKTLSYLNDNDNNDLLSLQQGQNFLNTLDKEKQYTLSSVTIEPLSIMNETERNIDREERVVDERERYIRRLQDDFNRSLAEYTRKYKQFMEEMIDQRNKNKEQTVSDMDKERTEKMKRYVDGIYASSEYDDYFNKDVIYSYPFDIKVRSWLDERRGDNFDREGNYIGKVESRLSRYTVKGPWIEFRLRDNPSITGMYILGPYPNLENRWDVEWYDSGTPREIKVFGLRGREWEYVGEYNIPEEAKVTKTNQKPYYVSFDRTLTDYDYIRLVVTKNYGNRTWIGLSTLEFSFFITSSDWKELNELNDRLILLANDLQREFKDTDWDESYIQRELDVQKRELNEQIKKLKENRASMGNINDVMNTFSGELSNTSQNMNTKKYTYIAWIIIVALILGLIIFIGYSNNNIAHISILVVAVIIMIIASISYSIQNTNLRYKLM